MSPTEIALSFVEAINLHDTGKIISLMSHDHLFIDTWGVRQTKTEMETGWVGYFEWFPDYLIEIEQIIQDGETVALFGFAGGTYKGIKSEDGSNTWRLPSVWRVTVAEDKVRIWQVYCDSKIPFDTMD